MQKFPLLQDSPHPSVCLPRFDSHTQLPPACSPLPPPEDMDNPEHLSTPVCASTRMFPWVRGRGWTPRGADVMGGAGSFRQIHLSSSGSGSARVTEDWDYSWKKYFVLFVTPHVNNNDSPLQERTEEKNTWSIGRFVETSWMRVLKKNHLDLEVCWL